jgi:hypothetical protein
MKKWTLLLALASTPLTLFAPQFKNACTISTDISDYDVPEFVFEPTGLDIFLSHIGFFESSNDYSKVNSLGFLGKYQFGKATLRGLGFDVSKKEFLNNPTLQDVAMQTLLKHNKKILQKYIDFWDGKTIKGMLITESGILAAAHLAGPTNVKNYFKRGDNPSDKYGTTLTKYLHKFSGYELQLN